VTARVVPAAIASVVVMGLQHDGTDRVVAGLAVRQRGVVARWQLLRAGVAARTIDRRLRDGRLHRFDPPIDGAYLVGHAVPAPWARETAALLVCGARAVAVLIPPGAPGDAARVVEPGSGAVLSHESALAAYGLASPGPIVAVTIVAGRRVARTGVRAHAVATLPARHVRRMFGLPVTSPARTIVDTAAQGTGGRSGR
jgi:hypothetical protein